MKRLEDRKYRLQGKIRLQDFKAHKEKRKG